MFTKKFFISRVRIRILVNICVKPATRLEITLWSFLHEICARISFVKWCISCPHYMCNCASHRTFLCILCNSWGSREKRCSFEMNIIIIEKRQKEEYQGRQLMEILFAVIFLSKKTTQYFVMGRFLLQIFKKCSSFHYWDIIHLKVFSFWQPQLL